MEPIIMFDAEAADGESRKILIIDWKDVVLDLLTENNANLTIKFYISNSYDAPADFTAAVTPTNWFAPVQVINIEDGSPTDGNTGIALSGTDVSRMLELQTNKARWVCAVISGYVAGNVTLRASAKHKND